MKRREEMYLKRRIENLEDTKLVYFVLNICKRVNFQQQKVLLELCDLPLKVKRAADENRRLKVSHYYKCLLDNIFAITNIK